MGRKKIPGLQKIGDIWHIDKRVDGCRICESTGTSKLEEAEQYLARRLEMLRQAKIYGVRPKRTFSQAAVKFLQENQHKRSIDDDMKLLQLLEKYIGDLALESVHMGTLQTYIEARRKDGVKTRTINLGLQAVRRIVNLAASEWMDEFGLTWLATAPKIKLLPERDNRAPYPLNWEEQERLFGYLPEHLKAMALFAVNTGCRDREVCRLKWEWEVKVNDADLQSVFIIPSEYVKNQGERLVVMNQIARAVIEQQRGKNSEYVFVYRGKPIYRMLNNAWKRARKLALLPVRVHDLKHTFGRRLRSAGVGFEDRQDLLGHKSSRITTHYSMAELSNLFAAANRVCERAHLETMTMLRVVQNRGHEKFTNDSERIVSGELETLDHHWCRQAESNC